MKKENRLPKYWICKSHPKVIQYLNSECVTEWSTSGSFRYYGFDGSLGCGGSDANFSIESFKNNPTLLTLEQFIEMTTEPEFKNGEKVLVRDKESQEWEECTFLCINNFKQNSNNYHKYVAVAEDGFVIGFKQCKPLSTIVEYTMKEAIEKMGFEFKIIK